MNLILIKKFQIFNQAFRFKIDNEKKIVGFTALFEILMILKRELAKEKNDEMKYSHFLCTLERANQEKLKMAIVQLKCVPCLNKFTTNFNLLNSPTQQQQSASLNTSSSSSKNLISHANMSRLLKQMSLIVSTELQQIAIDLIEKIDEDKPVKYIKLKEEFKISTLVQQQQLQAQQQQSPNSSNSVLLKQQQQQINNLMQIKNLSATFAKKVDLSSSSSSNASSSQQPVSPTPSNSSSSSTSSSTQSNSTPRHIFNPHSNLQQIITHEQKTPHDIASSFSPSIDKITNTNIYTERF